MNGNSSIALGYQNFAGGGGGLVFFITLKGNLQILLACCMLVFESEVIVIIQVYIGKFYIGQCLAIFIQHLHMLRALLLNKGIHFIMVGLVFYRVALVDDHVDFFTGVRQVYGELCTYIGVAGVACKGDANLLGCAVITKGVHDKLFQYVRLKVDLLPRIIRAAGLVGDRIVTGVLQIRGERFFHDSAQSVSDGCFNLILAHAGGVIHFTVLILQGNEGLCSLGSDFAFRDAGALGCCFREGESVGGGIKAGVIVVHGNRFITKLSLG